MTKTLKWYRLQEMKCPSCGARIFQKILENSVACSGCEFKIGMEKFNKVIADMYRPKRKQGMEDNQEALNNL